jgi:hypothetical protein
MVRLRIAALIPRSINLWKNEIDGFEKKASSINVMECEKIKKPYTHVHTHTHTHTHTHAHTHT